MPKEINEKCLKDVCSECKGKCCHEGVYITQKEYDSLSDYHKGILRVERHMAGYRTVGGTCSFLSDTTGCVLPIEQRFTECLLFPLEIAGLDSLIGTDCPHMNVFIGDGQYVDNCYKLLKDCVMKGNLTDGDVQSILNNPYSIG